MGLYNTGCSFAKYKLKYATQLNATQLNATQLKEAINYYFSLALGELHVNCIGPKLASKPIYIYLKFIILIQFNKAQYSQSISIEYHAVNMILKV